VTLLDAYALVALIADEPAADRVETILRNSGARIVVVNLAEAVDICSRVRNLSTEEVRAVIEPLILGNVLSLAVSDEPQAWLAAEIRAEHYDRRSAALSMADCFLLAHGMTDGGPIATSDPPLASVAAGLELEVIGLPDSSGKRP
jgi:uncharacterized protein with PIN domain